MSLEVGLFLNNTNILLIVNIAKLSEGPLLSKELETGQWHPNCKIVGCSIIT